MTNIRRAQTLIVTAALCCIIFPSSAQVTKGQIFGSKTSGAWSSYVVADKATMAFRAASQNEDGAVMVVIDTFGQECSQFLSFTFPFSPSLAQDVPTVTMPIVIRVDSENPHQLSAFFSGAMGDETGFITLHSTPQYNQLVGEMKRGHTLRVKVTIPATGLDNVFAFSLTGFTASYQRAIQGCTQAAAPKEAAPRPSAPQKPLGETIKQFL